MKKVISIAILLVLFALNAFAATLLPMPKLQFLTNSGGVLNGGRIYFYEVSSTTLKTVYSDSTESTPLTNPVVLDSAGRASIWLSGCYRVVVKTSADVTLYTTENVCEYAEANPTVSQWQSSGLTPTFVSSVVFSVPGDQTGTLSPGLRIRTTNTGGTAYSTIVSSAYTSLTTVTVINDSTVLDSGLSALDLSMLTVSNPALPVTPVSTKTTGYTLTPTDCGKTIIMNLSTAATLTVPNANTVPSGCSIVTKATGSTVTLAGTIDGVSNPTLSGGRDELSIWSNGTSWYSGKPTSTFDGTNTIKTKIISIGDWNMLSTASVNVAHGLTLANIRSVTALIRGDNGSGYYSYMVAPLSNPAYISAIDGTNVTLTRVGSSQFDNSNFDATSYNRGWITIIYVE